MYFLILIRLCFMHNLTMTHEFLPGFETKVGIGIERCQEGEGNQRIEEVEHEATLQGLLRRSLRRL